jgi:hypothetical protein
MTNGWCTRFASQEIGGRQKIRRIDSAHDLRHIKSLSDSWKLLSLPISCLYPACLCQVPGTSRRVSYSNGNGSCTRLVSQETWGRQKLRSIDLAHRLRHSKSSSVTVINSCHWVSSISQWCPKHHWDIDNSQFEKRSQEIRRKHTFSVSKSLFLASFCLLLRWLANLLLQPYI